MSNPKLTEAPPVPLGRKVERRTYANFVTFPPLQYERIHGIVTGYGGRVLDVKMRFNADNEVDLMYMFYEMPKTAREEFEKELPKQ